MKKLLSAFIGLALFSSLAMATVPDPPKCSVTPCDALNGVVLCPDQPSAIASSIVNMVIRNSSNNPINNAAVNISFGSGLCFCASMVYNTTTNAQGQATLTLRGGGCLTGVSGAAVIRANGVVVRSYSNAKSPDWAPNCDRRVDLGDLIRFAPRTDLCFDFDNVGGVDLGDIIIFTSGYTPAHSCP
jgi:hypothetical protein